jgi:hypothetical protein
MTMAYEEATCAPANVLDHADTVFNSAIALSQQVKEIVDHLCGAIPEPIGKQTEPSQASAFAHLRSKAADTLNYIQDAKKALHRLESEVGYREPAAKQGGIPRSVYNSL